MRTTACIAASMLLASAAGAADPGATTRPPRIVAIEQAVEASSDELALPAGGVGVVSFPGCKACKPSQLFAGTSTQWFVNTQRVGFAEVRSALATTRRSGVLVLYQNGTTRITRVIIYPGTR